MEITLAQEKAFNALVYFAERIKLLYLTKAIKLLYLADEKAIKETGVPITWLNYKAWKYGTIPDGIILDPEKAFDDSQFSDYEIDVLDAVIKEYGCYDGELQQQFELKNNRSDFVIEFTEFLDTGFKKAAFEVAYQSYLMQSNLDRAEWSPFHFAPK